MKSGALILMYHKIAFPKGAGLQRNLYVTPRMFRLQMWYLKQAGFSVVTLNDIVHLETAQKSAEKLIALTFDDGFRNFYEYALPILDEFQYPATVYIVSDLVGQYDVWEHQSQNDRESLMSWDEILTCQAHNITIGSHTRTHPRLSTLTPAQITSEIKDSRRLLEDRLGSEVQHFCYPYGDYTSMIAKSVADAGYVSAVTTRRGRVHAGTNPFELPRTFIRHATNPFLFLLRLHTDYEDRKAQTPV
jgi:peptidoglycan/xylan/chitin deacetylase (PgdA/CDA1 family)